jgi:hypothetical protein
VVRCVDSAGIVLASKQAVAVVVVRKQRGDRGRGRGEESERKKEKGERRKEKGETYLHKGHSLRNQYNGISFPKEASFYNRYIHNTGERS